jgi:hypothetical protein
VTTIPNGDIRDILNRLAVLEERVAANAEVVERMQTSITDTARIHADNHAQQHAATKEAISIAEAAMSHRLDALRIESGATTHRLEESIARSTESLHEAILGKGGVADRVRAMEDFKLSVQTQIGTMKAWMAVAAFLILAANFLIARFGG